MAAKKRAKGGGAFGGKGFKDADGEREPGAFHKLDKAAPTTKAGSKTSSGGFAKGGTAKAEGGAIAGAASAPSLAKRARGGRTGQPFSGANSMTDRVGSSSSGHEGE
jgi:hypothetical protein